MKTVLLMLLTLVTLVISQLGGAWPEISNDFQLRRGPEMNQERAAHQATLLTSGKVLMTGGCGGNSCQQRHPAAEVYDPDSADFAPAASMTTPRTNHNAIRLNDGRVLVTGGWSNQGVLGSTEIYDPETQRFTRGANLRFARAGHRVVALNDERLLIVGGERATNEALASAETFDPATNTFTPTDEMSTPRASHVAVRLADGRVLVAGGHAARGKLLRSAEIYDPAIGRFEPTGDMRTARHKHAAVLLDDGQVLIVGGSNEQDYDGRLRSTELFDPVSGRFARGPDTHAARHKIVDAVVKLPSGHVLIAGGARHPELFDPATQTWSVVRDALSGEQMFATATLMQTGDVLIAGGYDERTRSQHATWVTAAEY